MIPIFVNLKEFKVCIFGFGEVGRRRLNKIISANPDRITLYTKEEIDEKTLNYYKSLCNIEFITCNIEYMTNEEIRKIIKQHDFIITTIDEKNNKRIVSISKGLKKFVSSSTFERDINLIIPAYCCRDGIYFAIYTQGKSPLIAKNIRRLVENYIKNHDYEIDIQNNLRSFLKESISSQRDRKKILEKVFNNKNFKMELLELIEKYKK